MVVASQLQLGWGKRVESFCKGQWGGPWWASAPQTAWPWLPSQQGNPVSPLSTAVDELKSGNSQKWDLDNIIRSRFLMAPFRVLLGWVLGPSLQFLARIILTLQSLKWSITFSSQASLCSVALHVYPQEQPPIWQIRQYLCFPLWTVLWIKRSVWKIESEMVQISIVFMWSLNMISLVYAFPSVCVRKWI